MGVKFFRHNYVIVGWQRDDMPQFGKVEDIMVIEEAVYLSVISTETLGVDRHYHSFVINSRAKGNLILLLSELVDFYVYHAHFIKGCVYINVRSHIERMT